MPRLQLEARFVYGNVNKNRGNCSLNVFAAASGYGSVCFSVPLIFLKPSNRNVPRLGCAVKTLFNNFRVERQSDFADCSCKM